MWTNSGPHPCNGITVVTYYSKTYNTIEIGTQCWMKENLNTTKYRNGVDIPNVTDNSAWTTLTTGAYCNYNNDENYAIIYGRLYNWNAVADSRNLCPAGWHVPTDVEWTTLTTYLGGQSVAGGKLKEIGTTHWQNPNAGATNETGFTALPGGSRNGLDGSFNNVGYYCWFWSSSIYDTHNEWIRFLTNEVSMVYREFYGYTNGFSVRCAKD